MNRNYVRGYNANLTLKQAQPDLVGMQNAVVGHHYWDRPGGGQLVCASSAYALERSGYSPVLTSTTSFDPRSYIAWFGIDLSNYPRVNWDISLRMFGLQLRLVAWRPMLKAIMDYGAELLFTDEATYKPLLKHKSGMGFRIIEYMHFDLEVSIDPRFKGTGLSYGEDPYIVERYGKFPMNLYWWSYVKLLPRYMRKDPFESADLVLTNSAWTSELGKKIYGKAPEVLNPPLPPNVPVLESAKPFEERQKTVIMLGRFSEEKRYHWVINKVMPMLVKEVPGVKLQIFGGAGTRTAMGYIERLKRMVRQNGLEGSVTLVPDAKRQAINDAMDGSRVFLHSTINEHWGIVVAEALARRLPIVIHKSGGAWSDIAKEGEYGLGYQSANDAVEAISKLLTDNKIWNKYSTSQRVKELTIDSYVSKFGALLKKME